MMLSASILISALVLAGALFFVGADISKQIGTIKITAGSGQEAGAQQGGAQTAGTANTGGSAAQKQVTFQGLVESALIIGDSNAKVTVLEFSDFSCPFCAASAGFGGQDVIDYLKSRDPQWEPIGPKFIEEYVKTGKVKLAIKYYPGHGTGQQAQLVSWCAYDQNPDYFAKFHDIAYKNQGEANDAAKMKGYAVQVGADAAKLDECLKSNKYVSRLDTEAEEGSAIGVSGTPYYYINNASTVLKGAYSYSYMKQAIDAELAKQ